MTPQGGFMSSDQAKAIAQRFFDEVCNGRNQSAADDLFAPTHEYHDPSSPWVGSGPGGMKQLTSTYYTAFADAHWGVDEMIAGDDGTVVTRWTARGTHTAELQGLPATGRRVTVQGIWIHRVRDGKIQESWNVWDTLGMLQQLEVVPKLSSAAATS